MILLGSWELTVMFQMPYVLAVQWDGAVGRTWLRCKTGLTESNVSLPHWRLALLTAGIKDHCFSWMAAWLHTRKVPPPLHQMCYWKAKGFYDFILKRSLSKRAFFTRRQASVSHGVLSVLDKYPCISQHPWHTAPEVQHFHLSDLALKSSSSGLFDRDQVSDPELCPLLFPYTKTAGWLTKEPLLCMLQ